MRNGPDEAAGETAPTHGPGNAKALAVLLAVGLALSLALGVAKLYVDRAHLPSWATPTFNTYEGFISIDQYGPRSERMRAWIRGEDPGGEVLLSHLRATGHATAVLVPWCIGALSLATGSIVLSFTLLSAFALVLQVLLAALLAAKLARGSPLRVGLAAGILVAAHCDSARTAAQLILDQFTATAATLVVLLALRWLERRDVATTAALLAALIAVPFLKVAALPILAVPAVLAWFVPPVRTKGLLGGALTLGFLPFALMQLYAAGVLDHRILSAEVGSMFRDNVATSSSMLHFALEMALLFQFLPLLFVLDRAALSRATRGALAVALLLLLSVASVRLHDDMRLYLPVLGVLAASAAPSLARMLPGRRLFLGLLVFAVLNLSLAAAGLLV